MFRHLAQLLSPMKSKTYFVCITPAYKKSYFIIVKDIWMNLGYFWAVKSKNGISFAWLTLGWRVSADSSSFLVRKMMPVALIMPITLHMLSLSSPQGFVYLPLNLPYFCPGWITPSSGVTFCRTFLSWVWFRNAAAILVIKFLNFPFQLVVLCAGNLQCLVSQSTLCSTFTLSGNMPPKHNQEHWLAMQVVGQRPTRKLGRPDMNLKKRKENIAEQTHTGQT